MKKSSYRPTPAEQESLPNGRRSAQKTLLLDDDLKPAFTQIPNWLYTMKGPSVQARHMFGYLLMYARESDHCWPGQDTISKDLSVTRFTAMRWLQELEDWGLLLVHRRGLGHSNVYYLRSNKHLKKPEEVSRPPTLDVAEIAHQPGVTDMQHQKVTDLPLPKVVRHSHKQDVVEQDAKEQDAASAAAARAKPVEEGVVNEDVLRLRNALGATCQALGVRPTKAHEADLAKFRSTHSYSLDEFIYSMSLATSIYQDRAAEQDIGSPWRYYRKILENELGDEQPLGGDLRRPHQHTGHHDVPEPDKGAADADGSEGDATDGNAWDVVKESFQGTMTRGNYQHLIAPTRQVAEDADGTLVVAVPTEFHRVRFDGELATRIKREAGIAGVEAAFRFIVDGQDAQPAAGGASG